MKPMYALSACYAAAALCLLFRFYCGYQGGLYFDFKAGIGSDMAEAAVWQGRALAAALIGGLCVAAGSFFAPFESRWENAALAVCALCAYFIMLVLPF